MVFFRERKKKKKRTMRRGTEANEKESLEKGKWGKSANGVWRGEKGGGALHISFFKRRKRGKKKKRDGRRRTPSVGLP